MGRIEKLRAKFFRKPIPNDITFDEMVALFEHYGCIIRYGKHPNVCHKESGTVIPVPRHGKAVGEVYIKQLKDILEILMDEEKGL